MSSLIIVSNRLPVTITDTISKSSGGLVSAVESLADTFDVKWVGWAGGVVSDEQHRNNLSRQLVEQYRYWPIFLDAHDVENYYNGFSNASLWPLLHYMTSCALYKDQWWDCYKRVNDVFGERVSAVAGEDDIVWIHDYHLMLLPRYLRQNNPSMTIGFFLHTPFPSYEIFRCHPNRNELLYGLLGADLIGFHTYGYLRHFRSTILRVLGIESEITRIVQENHVTELGVYPIGINAGKFNEELDSPDCLQSLEEYQKAFNGKKVVLCVERLDYTKGVPNRLDAIERFLRTTACTDDVVFIFICVPSREQVAEYRKLIDTVRGKVSKINGKYSSIKNVPIHFIHKSVTFSQLCALYALADVAMVTPLVDGMNLVAKEYLACQKGKAGVLILSEFAGAAQELYNAIIVNPYDCNQMAQCLKEALSLSDTEKENLTAPMKEKVLRYDAKYWAKAFVGDLAAAAIKDGRTVIVQEISTDMIGIFSHANRIAFFLDYDGTLSEIKKMPNDALPNAEIKSLFLRLRSEKRIDVFVVSGRKKEDMDRWFSEYGFKLIAEHGFFYKLPGSPQWMALNETADLSWMDQLNEILQLFTGTTPGSFVERKTGSVVWHYRASDPEFGAWRANQLVGELYEMLSNLPVKIYHGKKIVEVSSMQVNKGVAVRHFLNLTDYDAVLCAGDDETDESMFNAVADRTVSIKVGEGQTAAKYRIPSPRAFREFLSQVLDTIGTGSLI